MKKSNDYSEAAPGTGLPETGPHGFLELLRRFILIGGVFGALYSWFGFNGALWRVEPCDFEKRLEERRTGGASPWFRADAREDRERHAAMPLADFIAQETEGRRLRLAGPEWEALLNSAQAAERGAAWQERRGLNQFSRQFFFRGDEVPFTSLAGKLAPAVTSVYLEVQAEGPPRYLFVVRADPSDLHLAPNAVACPWRAYALPLLLLGLLGYALLPWSRIPVHAVHYLRSGLVQADLVGIVFGGAFFAAPLLIFSAAGGPDPGRGLLDWSSSSALVTLLFWLFAFLFCCILFSSARYSSLQFLMTPEGLRVWTLWGGPRIIPFAEIEALRKVTFWSLRRQYRWWGIPRRQREYGIGIHLRNGRCIRMPLAGLQNARKLIEGLPSSGVAIDAAVFEFADMSA